MTADGGDFSAGRRKITKTDSEGSQRKRTQWFWTDNRCALGHQVAQASYQLRSDGLQIRREHEQAVNSALGQDKIDIVNLNTVQQHFRSHQIVVVAHR